MMTRSIVVFVSLLALLSTTSTAQVQVFQDSGAFDETAILESGNNRTEPPRLNKNARLDQVGEVWQHDLELKGSHSWHHIIPLQSLRAIWSAMWNGYHAADDVDTRIAYLVLIDKFMICLNIPEPRRLEVLELASNNRLRQLTQAKALRKQIEWPRWNIVDGPNVLDRPQCSNENSRRAGCDPGNALDMFYATGLSQTESELLLIVAVLADHFFVPVADAGYPPRVAMATIHEYDPPTQMIEWLYRVLDLIEIRTQTVLRSKRLPIRYRGDMWDDDNYKIMGDPR